MNEQFLSVDFCVIGGGLAGVSAALAAARRGLRVVLVQDRSVLGGNASSEIKMHAVGADCHGWKSGARESGLIEQLRLEEAYRNPQRSHSLWDLLLYEKVKQETNITLLLETACRSCRMDETGRRIVEVRAVRHSTEDTFRIQAQWFADCSGDGCLGAMAGADFRIGREAKSEFDESLALDQADSQTLGSSILLTARKHSRPMPFIAPDWVRQFHKSDFRHRPIHSYEYGYWWSEWGGQLDTIKDNEVIRHELLRIALGVWDYIKNSGNHADSANWALDWVGAIPGKRESRRFLGDHVLTQNDISSGTLFPDRVAYGGWPMDLHPPTGVDAAEESPCVQHHFDHLYTIPLRSLYSRNIENLLFAGRNISATHVAFASTRVMATCSIMGQAIGTAAVVGCQMKLSNVRSLAQPPQIGVIQQTLMEDDAFLPNLTLQHRDDVAAHATLSASSEEAGCPARAIVDGVTRALKPQWGAWSDSGEHQWRSRELPAWIEFDLGKKMELREVRLTFDSGFQRELTLSLSDDATSKMIRGAQPELVRDYELWFDEKKIAAVKGNYQRHRVHRLEGVACGRRFRLVVNATHGASEARVFDIKLIAA